MKEEYKVGDIVVIIETDNTSLHYSYLGRTVTVLGHRTTSGLISRVMQGAVDFKVEGSPLIYYALCSSIRKLSPLERLI